MNRLFTAQPDSVVTTISGQLQRLYELQRLGPRATAVTPEQIATFMETTFWASLRTNESRPTRFSAALVRPGDVEGLKAFASSVTYDEGHISKISPALPIGGWFAVSTATEPFEIWGFGQGSVYRRVLALSVAVSEPGILRVGVGPYRPYAILDGRSDPVIAATEMGLEFAILDALRKPAADVNANHRECRLLGILARAVLAEGHGGALVLVPSVDWTESLNIAHRFNQVDSTMHDFIRQNLESESANATASVEIETTDIPENMKDLLRSALAYRPPDEAGLARHYATFAAVDGAVVLTKDMRVLGYGAKLTAASAADATVCIMRPLADPQKVIPVPLEESGGTRHQSAVRFVLAHHETVALVISQDRHLSIIYWEPKIDSVILLRNAEWLE